MPNEPQDRRPEWTQFGEGPDPYAPEEVAEPGRKPNAADTDVAIYGHRRPSPFPQRPRLEVKVHSEPARSMTVIPAQAGIHGDSTTLPRDLFPRSSMTS